MQISLAVFDNVIFHDIIKETFSDPDWVWVLLLASFLLFLFGIKAYADSPVRNLGPAAYLAAIGWATIVPALAFAPILAVASLTTGFVFVVREWFGLGIGLLLLLPAMVVFGLVSIFIVCALLAVPDFIGKKLVRSVEKGKAPPPLGTAKIKD